MGTGLNPRKKGADHPKLGYDLAFDGDICGNIGNMSPMMMGVSEFSCLEHEHRGRGKVCRIGVSTIGICLVGVPCLMYLGYSTPETLSTENDVTPTCFDHPVQMLPIHTPSKKRQFRMIFQSFKLREG